MHYATHRSGRIVGHGEGSTPEEAKRAAIIDAADRPALEPAPLRPGSATLLAGMAGLAIGLLGLAVVLL